jgi:hypothetical protein
LLRKRRRFVKPVYDKTCGLHVLIGRQKVLFENGVFIDRRSYEEWTAAGTIKKCAEDLRRDPDCGGFDYDYAAETGEVRRKPAPAKQPAKRRIAAPARKPPLPEPKVIAPEPPVPARDGVFIPVPAVVRALPEVRREVPGEAGRFSSAALVAFVMAVVGAGSAVMSAYHTTVFLIQGGKPAWTAVMTGVMLILFSGTAFTAARYFFKEGGAVRFVGALFLAAALAVTAYSVFGTLSVNFAQFRAREDTAEEEAAAGSGALAAHGRILAENRAALDEAARELGRLEGEAAYWRERSWQRYDGYQAALASLREGRDRLREERKALEARSPVLAEAAALSRETVYGFLARLMGLPEDAVRFFVYAVPACLYDVLAPFALSVVLLLAERRGGVYNRRD